MGVFQTILQNGLSRGHIPGKFQTSRDWYRDAAKSFGGRIRGNDSRVDYARARDLTKKLDREYRGTDREKSIVKPGSMYMYTYDAKYKDTLPFWDRFPLIFPFRVEHDRFWGFNFHYINLPMRAKLMDALHDITNNNKYDESTKLVMNYKLLNSSSKFSYFKPCIKQYLLSHVRSKFMYIHPEEWDIALFAPLDSFVGASKSQVWSKSKKSAGVSK